MKRIFSYPELKGFFILLLVSFTYVTTYAQSVEIKDADDNIMMSVEDEGLSGSIHLYPAYPDDPVGKLYCGSSSLFFNGNELSTVIWRKWANHIYYDLGRVGIGTYDPYADLHVVGDDGVLFQGTFGDGTIPVEGPGTRLIWYPHNAAFRAGGVSGAQWDASSLGPYSIGLGYNTFANENYSVAIGLSDTATGVRSVAMGYACVATSNSSIALGAQSKSTGLATLAAGSGAIAGGNCSVALGSHTTAIGNYSFAFGRSISATGDYSVAIGLDYLPGDTVTEANTMAIMGGLVGIGTLAPLRKFEVHDSINSYVAMVKNNNTSGGDGLRVALKPTNPTSSNRFVEFLRDDVTAYAGWICGDGTGGVLYSETSDARLKMNIEDYHGGLDKVKEIKVKHYEMKSAPGIEKVGLIAQELKEIYPQVVSGDPNGNVDEEPMGIDYGQITPLLVSAIQEQQKIIEELKVEIEFLKANLMAEENDKD